MTVRAGRSVAIPMALTCLALLGLTLAVADFKPIRMRISSVARTGSPPKLRIKNDHPRHTRECQHEYRVEGIAEEGLYRQIDGINLSLFRLDPSQFQGRKVIAWRQIAYDQRSRTFSGTIWVGDEEKEQGLYLSVGVGDRIRPRRVIGPRSPTEDCIPFRFE